MDVINRRKVMKKTLKSIVLLGALCGGSLHASFEFRSPLSVQDRGYMHWLLAPADQAWWYDSMPSAKKNTDWNIHMWGAAYTRQANRAFAKRDECQSECPNSRADECSRNKVTRNTTTLSELFFGQTVFRGEEAFAGGTFAGTSNLQTQLLVNNVNPFLAFAQIAPNLTYEETGANMGIDFAKYVGRDNRWHVGGRANIPFKIIEVEQDGFFEEGLDDVFVTRIIASNADASPDQIEYAMRYDFLSSLVFSSTAMPSGTVVPNPVVRYVNPGTPGATIQLTGRALTGNTPADNDAVPAAYATINDCGDLPAVPFRKSPDQVTGFLGADGEGENGAILFFKTGVDYAGELANDRAAQARVFVTPRSIATTGVITDDSEAILDNVRAIIDGDLLISEPATAFFLNNGIDLAGSSRVVGIGDFATEFYFGYGHYNDWFVDGIFGITFPTGKRQKHANQVYYKPTGNNGHVEIKLEFDGGWQPRPWFAFEIRPSFNHAFKRSEKRAAPFAGATIVNVGPEVEVDVSWSYFVLRTDFSFFHPHNPDLGFVLGYELFAKGHDHVSLDCQTTATNFLGQTDQPLDVELYKRNTNSLSNKLRGQIFYRMNYFEIFGGGTQIISGRHMMKETEGNIGLAIYF
jgi:hypothetical protein